MKNCHFSLEKRLSEGRERGWDAGGLKGLCVWTDGGGEGGGTESGAQPGDGVADLI